VPVRLAVASMIAERRATRTARPAPTAWAPVWPHGDNPGHVA
jgi:hypothetical protein